MYLIHLKTIFFFYTPKTFLRSIERGHCLREIKIIGIVGHRHVALGYRSVIFVRFFRNKFNP